MHDRNGYESRHIAIDPSHWYAERWGHTHTHIHTPGSEAAGSLGVHTTVALWNAHHAWEIRTKTPQCMENTVHTILRLSYCKLTS